MVGPIIFFMSVRPMNPKLGYAYTLVYARGLSGVHEGFTETKNLVILCVIRCFLPETDLNQMSSLTIQQQ